MVKLYSGTPGSGKSLHTAEKIYYALRAGRPVIANFDINLGIVQGRRRKKVDFTHLPNDQLTVSALESYSRDYFAGRPVKEERILLIIDEAQLIFNAREWCAAGRKDWLGFFSQHRKYGYEIILVAQFDRMLDRQIRSVIEYEYIHRRVSNFGRVGKLMSLFTLGRLFVAVEMWYPLRERIGAEWFVCRKKIFRLYDTFKDFTGTAATSIIKQKSRPALEELPKDCPAETPDRDLGLGDLHAKFYEVS